MTPGWGFGDWEIVKLRDMGVSGLGIGGLEDWKIGGLGDWGIMRLWDYGIGGLED